MLDGARAFTECGDAARDHQAPVIHPVFLHVVEEHRLIGESVSRIAIKIVEVKKIVVQKARWSGTRNNKGGTNLSCVAQGTSHLVDALLAPQGLLGLLG